MAQEYARRALALDKQQALAYVALAYVHDISRRWDDGLAFSEHAYTLNPNNFTVLAHLGMRLINFGHVDEGIRIWERVVELNPFDGTVRSFYGGNLFAAQRFDDAQGG